MMTNGAIGCSKREYLESGTEQGREGRRKREGVYQ